MSDNREIMNDQKYLHHFQIFKSFQIFLIDKVYGLQQMIFYKYKRCIQIMFGTKQLIAACLRDDIHIIVTSSTLLFILFMLLKCKHFIWKHLKVILLIELCLYDVPYCPAIIATMNKNLNHKWIILIFYSVRIGVKYALTFEIIDWVYFSIQFLAIMAYLKNKKSSEGQEKLRKKSYINMGSITESVEVFEILNHLPCGICLLDNNLTVVNANSKAQTYATNNAENNIQQAIFMMIQKSYLQTPGLNSFRKNERHRSIIDSLDENSDFGIKRLQSFCIPRRSTVQQKLNISNISDIAQIINKHKIKSIDETKLNSLKYKDQSSGETFEIRIFEISAGIMIVIENITNQENQQDMQDRYRFYSKLINSFSHELRTPLNCSLQLLQILDENIKDELNTKYLKPSIISNKKLLHQINDILDYANFEAQMFKLRPQLFKLSTITKMIEYYFRAECEQKQIQLFITSCDETWINNDYDRIMQILVNLMNNSVKYTKQYGEIHFTIQRAGSIYQFEVYDTGCGIQIEKLYLINKILKNCELEWSQRGDEDYMQYVGLGLKVSSRIARKLCDQGELLIFSSVNQFTKSKFYIKDMKRIEESQGYMINMAQTEDHIQVPYKSISRLKCQCVNVLLCDDIPFNHLALSTVLQFLKIKSDSAYDGRMAIEMVKQKLQLCNCGYKLIFMDIDMPDMDGCQVTKEILSIYTLHGIKCNIIMCSAFDSKENIDYALKSGMIDVLPKPVDTNLLKKILQKYYF